MTAAHAKWETVIGLEAHTQLSTKSKIFSGASTAFGAPPNAQASAIDLALPGTLPVTNKLAVEYAIRFGLAIGAHIAPHSVLARKNYFYPDLPKGYQISQYELPIVGNGKLPIMVGEKEMIVRITRAHLEEDAGKSIHGEALSGVAGMGIPGLMRPGVPLVNEYRDLSEVSGIDLNRAGTPLLEIVSEPDMRSAAEAVAYARALHALVRWIGICDGNMQEGSFRVDANVSVRLAGSEKLGTRCEIKNLNSFRFMEKAIEFEVRRQIELIEDGGGVVQETRLYDPERDETRPMRSKEDAHDYRYFPDPDLLPLAVSEAMLEGARKSLPELPAVRRERFAKEYGLSAYDAALQTASREAADFYEAAAKGGSSEIAKLVANIVSTNLSAKLHQEDLDISRSRVTPQHVRGLAERRADGTISSKIEKEVFEAIWNGEGDADAIIEKRGLKQVSDAGAIEKIVDDVLAANARQVADYKAGKDKAFNSLVGQVMKASSGRANPARVNEILKRKLGG
jgi:aspartyl-tRNA(Asn)/glutamyl-tRNA(Gln) amidotransferase subunit B